MNRRPSARAILLTASVLLGVSALVASVAVRWPAEIRATHAAPGADDRLTGAVLLDLDDSADAEDLLALSARVRAAIAPVPWPSGALALGTEIDDASNLFRLRPPASELDDLRAVLRDHEGIEGFEMERRWSVPEGTRVGARAGMAPPSTRDGDGFRPNDPYYRHQWHLDQIGMPEAWTHQRGSGVVVAVIDTGVAHRDEDRFALAPDLHGTEMAAGWDFVDNDPHADDEHGHGTHVAGTIAQATNNGIGVAGVAPRATIMPLRVLDRNGSGGWGAIAAAIRYAADHGAHVINMSLGGGFPSSTVQRAITYAHAKGVLVVAAAGNSGRSTVEYPSRHDHVVSVGSVRFDRTLAFYSNYGGGLDIVAPGGDLRVDQNGDGMPDGVIQNTMVGGDPQRFDYLAWQGTSMASPHVAGVAALIYSAGIRDPDAVEGLLKRTATDLGDGRKYASGLVHAAHALRVAGQGAPLARGGLAMAFTLLALVGLRRRRVSGVGLLPSSGWAFALAGGLGVLPWALVPALGVPLDGALGQGALGASALATGPWGALLLWTVAPAALLTAVGYHLERARPLLVGFCFATAGFLAVEALFPTARIALLPAVVVGPWLLLHALGAATLGRLVARA